ncbi:YggS family pyridoxal phosphate-dependent enzyme [Gloeocapsopsis dulcis]|uniref:Pyridoxal phosphate homeostasis protein n=1 Tax=Gloeocapsopsis dulcis AAB1 = 1H9 TaxID=1433147 RepID=A0A6N8FVJ6_9CHRO|nr:YggS family pyridoxal phosphate-dependent enzyme [Gloeocapsopsis dulcis]MUL36889.1 YggS family pyridoxal phosphate enzyme [Gloeocapsopsis dulcis AAB1 = 1H9]WNN88703.1 YggS family pyridoxal phosphate-dependent enzyme [Gloeocapsopsis dulcis]
MSSIAERIAQIRKELPDTVRLIAVTKQVSVAAMREAYAAGVRDFGESRVQEAASKQAQLHDLTDVTWHMIGRLQANKAKKALELFQWIHSVDSLKLAQRLNQLAIQESCQPKICLQVKLQSDPNKTGWTIPELLNDLPALNQCERLNIQGLMTIPPLGLNDVEILNFFNQTRALAINIREQHWSNLQMQQLSMGMSNDYYLAVQAGTTMVRLGRILFGARPTVPNTTESES